MTIVGEVRKEICTLSEGRRDIVDQYLTIVESTMRNQGKIMESYEGLVKKLETQIGHCQVSLDESTRREIEQLQLIMECKLQIESRKKNKAIKAVKEAAGEVIEEKADKCTDCNTCEAYEMENQLLKEQTSKQQEVIDKLSEA